MRIRERFKGSGRFTWWRPGAEIDFLAARTGPPGKANWWRHKWQ